MTNSNIKDYIDIKDIKNFCKGGASVACKKEIKSKFIGKLVYKKRRIIK